MAKIFDLLSDTNESPNRNTFDLMHKRHMTGKAGVITPFLVLPHVPTDSFDIDVAIGANLMPMWYPTQSNMRFIVHVFDIPYRIMQKNFKNMLEGLIEENFPYLDVPATYYKTGSLADYLGVPTNLVIGQRDEFSIFTDTEVPRDDQYVFMGYDAGSYTLFGQSGLVIPDGTYGLDNRDYEFRVSGRSVQWYTVPRIPQNVTDKQTPVIIMSHNPLVPIDPAASSIVLPIAAPKYVADSRPSAPNYETKYRISVVDAHDKLRGSVFVPDVVDGAYNAISFPQSDVKYSLVCGAGNYSQNLVVDGSNNPLGTRFFVDAEAFNAGVADCETPILFVECIPIIESGTYDPEYVWFPETIHDGFGRAIKYYHPAGVTLEISKNTQYSPFFHTLSNIGTDTIKLSAFAFRAYDMLYNSYYRNSQGNQPFVVDGVTKYNEYLRTDGDGSDTNQYELKTRNWELDAYTSCLPSPQQGPAPIVAVNALGRMTIQDDDGTTSVIELRDLENGEAGLEVRNMDIQNPEHARMAMRVASSGLSIEDFREGNALQRFLEQSLRSGYRYADFIFGHFGKAPSHQELDMPIFIGGYTQVVDTSKISNVSASGDAPLGQFAGVGASFGGSNHKIKHYCDDYGIIIGVMTLVPDAAYSQILPKHFLYHSRLDFYFPEFSQLGMQPITYQEVCPIQSHKEYVDGDTSKLMTDTFGYQRPNHEYIWMMDSLHGLFRTNLNGSVVNRRFGSRPELGDDFLRIHPEEVNDIFSMVEANDDIYIAQVVCDIKATRPIPRVVIPGLGR